MTRPAPSFAPDSAKAAGLDWDNLAERMAPELRIDILPEWVVAQYRAHFPAYTPEQIFYAATTAGRSWRGQVIEAEARAAARRADLRLSGRFPVADAARARRAAHDGYPACRSARSTRRDPSPAPAPTRAALSAQ